VEWLPFLQPGDPYFSPLLELPLQGLPVPHPMWALQASSPSMETSDPLSRPPPTARLWPPQESKGLNHRLLSPWFWPLMGLIPPSLLFPQASDLLSSPELLWPFLGTNSGIPDSCTTAPFFVGGFSCGLLGMVSTAVAGALEAPGLTLDFAAADGIDV
jgi:hypothetical protein